MEEALRRSENHLQTLINTIPDLVWLKEPNGVYMACNARFSEFYGASEQEIIGKTNYDFVSTEQADSLVRTMQRRWRQAARA